jgi:hypothetical protein
MTTMTAKNDVLDVRESSPEELSLEELDVVSGGWSISLPFGGKITGGDVVDAAKWVWNKL